MNRRRRAVDVTALIVGLAAVGIAAGILVDALIVPLNRHVVAIGAPVGLVVLGVLGLALNRGSAP